MHVATMDDTERGRHKQTETFSNSCTGKHSSAFIGIGQVFASPTPFPLLSVALCLAPLQCRLVIAVPARREEEPLLSVLSLPLVLAPSPQIKELGPAKTARTP